LFAAWLDRLAAQRERQAPQVWWIFDPEHGKSGVLPHVQDQIELVARIRDLPGFGNFESASLAFKWLRTINYDSLILDLLPKTPEQVAEVEQAVVEASADPQSRKLAEQLGERLARPEIANMTRWAVFVLASADFIKLTENSNPNVLQALSIIVMVWLYLVQSSKS
jgi:hypothetical protein